jgi:hypothetical protein
MNIGKHPIIKGYTILEQTFKLSKFRPCFSYLSLFSMPFKASIPAELNNLAA